NYGGIDIRKFPFGYSTPMRTLDNFFLKEDEKQHPKRVDLVVIDVNGMEAEVLNGAKRLLEKYTPHLYLGNNFAQFSPATIRAAEEIGYNLYWHIPKMYNPSNDAQVKENIFEGMVTVNLIGVHKKYPVNMRLQRVRGPEEYPQRKK
ncbi:MAG: FkbM family methyltransferase, partial [Candidatus Sumerlaeia bacterium]|nr:FkbM family methyltransferase [Candidatus Sumerlaeia bacterium]